MKRIFIICLLTFASLFYGRAQTGHLSFKGVPIDGTLDHYVKEMRQKGFTLVNTEKGYATLRGDFAGIKDCEVNVCTLDAVDLVSNIGVIFPAQITWTRLEGDYRSLKRDLTTKYGQPSECVERFDSPYIDDDSDRLHSLMFDTCRYYTVWSTELGDIELSLQRDELLHCYVFLKYYDRANDSVIHDAILEDL